MNRQWSSWRPGGAKSKGKGKSGFGTFGSNKYGGKCGANLNGMDVNKLVFPPLCSVNPAETDWSGADQMSGEEWAEDAGRWIGVLKVKN